jgi:hypothetical protein
VSANETAPSASGRRSYTGFVPLRISRSVALVVGIALPLIETWRRWNMLADWSAWLDDYIAAALLLYAWHSGRRDASQSRPYLMAAWGYTVAMAYMSLFGQLRAAPSIDPSGASSQIVIGFKTFGLALAVTSLALAWRGPVR